jgi:hypothetical protein
MEQAVSQGVIALWRSSVKFYKSFFKFITLKVRKCNPTSFFVNPLNGKWFFPISDCVRADSFSYKLFASQPRINSYPSREVTAMAGASVMVIDM